MLFRKSVKNSQVKVHTEFLGSTQDKFIHSTEHPCQDALNIDPDHRWYVRTVPKSGEYIKCSKCFIYK